MEKLLTTLIQKIYLEINDIALVLTMEHTGSRPLSDLETVRSHFTELDVKICQFFFIPI